MNGIFKTIFWGSIMLLLVGCNNTTVDKNFAPSPSKNNLSQVMWWRSMHDPVLNTLITRALNNNNQVLAAQANIMQAQAQLKAAHNAWLPTLNGNANAFGGKGWDTRIQPEGSLSQTTLFNHIDNLNIKGFYAGFVPNYSLNLLENINNTKLAKASLEEQKAFYNATRLSIISQTAGAYFSLLGYKEQLAEQKQLIQHLKKLRELENVRYKGGANDYSNLATVDQQIADNQAYTASIETSIVQTQNALQLLTNHAPGSILIHKTLDSVVTQKIIPIKLSAQVLQSRPDIMISREQLNRADANLGLSYSRLFPQFSLTGLLGGSSVELVHLLKLSTGLGVAQLSALVPLFNGVNYQQIQAAKSGVKAAYYNYLHTVLAALVDVDNNLTHYQKSKEYCQNQLQAYKASLRAYRIQQSRYKNGYQDCRGVINASLTADKARINFILAKMEQLNSLVLVYQSVGGGYQAKQ